jgi:hypothetical protein
MDTKFCTECGNKTVATAKFCGACGTSFAAASAGQVASVPQPKPTSTPKPKGEPQTIVFDTDATDEEGESTSVEQQLLNNPHKDKFNKDFNYSFADLVVAKGGGARSKGVKMDDVIGKAKGEGREKLQARRPEGPTNFKSIMKDGETHPRKKKK